MWWALFWGFVVGGATNSAWAGFFALLLSLAWQEHTRYEKRLVEQRRQIIDLQEESRMLQDRISESKNKVRLPDPMSPAYEAEMDYLRDKGLI